MKIFARYLQRQRQAPESITPKTNELLNALQHTILQETHRLLHSEFALVKIRDLLKFPTQETLPEIVPILSPSIKPVWDQILSDFLHQFYVTSPIVRLEKAFLLKEIAERLNLQIPNSGLS